MNDVVLVSDDKIEEDYTKDGKDDDRVDDIEVIIQKTFMEK